MVPVIWYRRPGMHPLHMVPRYQGTGQLYALCSLCLYVGYPCADPYQACMPLCLLCPLLQHTHSHYASYGTHVSTMATMTHVSTMPTNVPATHTCPHCQLHSKTAACNAHYGTHLPTMPTAAHVPTASAMAHPYGCYGRHMLKMPATAHTCPTVYLVFYLLGYLI